jgi:ferredoxin/coenzyme F420-reducing hydrogenase delta subunit
VHDGVDLRAPEASSDPPAEASRRPAVTVRGDPLKRGLRWVFLHLERWMDAVFGAEWNPLYHLGALGFFYLWVVVVSGFYLYIFFDTGTTAAYDSVEYLTYDQWYLGGVMRSLHRYASDGMMLMMGVHMLREFSMDRYRGPRWFTWVTGGPVLWLVFISGLSGYWLVWDMLAQYVAVMTTEWLDSLPIFGASVARNFLSPGNLDDRFFTLMMFIHIAAPLILLLVLWIHLQRVSRPRINPRRGLAIGTFVMLIALSFVKPAESQGAADLSRVPAEVGLDWFYLVVYPLLDVWSHEAVWLFVGAASLMLVALPWMPPMRRIQVAEVDLANCNGCGRCADDCPYNAITMAPRSDDLPFETEARVSPTLCVACGICAGSCPTSTPFRRATELVPGIDLPDLRLRDLRSDMQAQAAALGDEPKVFLIGCQHGVRVEDLASPSVAATRLPCIAQLPPPFIDYLLSRDLADGVFLTGCRKEACQHRFGIEWTEQRLEGTRDPRLRKRVPRDRVAQLWVGPGEKARLAEAIEAFKLRLQAMPASDGTPPPEQRPESETVDA